MYPWGVLSLATVLLWHAMFCNVCTWDIYRLSKQEQNRLLFQTELQQRRPMSDLTVQCLQETDSLKQNIICINALQIRTVNNKYIIINWSVFLYFGSTKFSTYIWNYHNFMKFLKHDSPHLISSIKQKHWNYLSILCYLQLTFYCKWFHNLNSWIGPLVINNQSFYQYSKQSSFKQVRPSKVHYFNL